MSKIELGKTYRTRDGREVRIYAVDGAYPFSVHGAVKNDGGGWVGTTWRPSGEAGFSEVGRGNDIFEVRPRVKRTVWLNVYPGGVSFNSYDTKHEADERAAPQRLACVKVDIDVEEGEGL